MTHQPERIWVMTFFDTRFKFLPLAAFTSAEYTDTHIGTGVQAKQLGGECKPVAERQRNKRFVGLRLKPGFFAKSVFYRRSTTRTQGRGRDRSAHLVVMVGALAPGRSLPSAIAIHRPCCSLRSLGPRLAVNLPLTSTATGLSSRGLP